MSGWTLALETSSEACSVALLGADALHVEHCVAPRRHTALLVPMIEAVLHAARCRPAEVTLVAFGRGPGSFTGVRIAAAAAQGFALAHACPLIGISSLAALAAGAARRDGRRHLLCALDARRSEIYAGAYQLQDTTWRLHGKERVLSPGALELPDAGSDWSLVGHGFVVYAGQFNAPLTALPLLDLPYPLAEDVARLARTHAATGSAIDPSTRLPVYLRAAVD